METKTKQLLNRNFTGKEQQYPIKVLQFGEGNFLRAFVDYAFYRLNNELSFNAGIAVVQPLEGGMVDLIEKQDGLYTLFLNGIKNKQPIIYDNFFILLSRNCYCMSFCISFRIGNGQMKITCTASQYLEHWHKLGYIKRYRCFTSNMNRKT